MDKPLEKQMSTLTDKYTSAWCREHPDQASMLIAHYEQEWANCSQHCAKIQDQRDAPAYSLARLKAQWQAEALREARHQANVQELSIKLIIEMMLEELGQAKETP